MQKLYQKYVDMGLKMDEKMYGWVGFFIFGPHTPVNFLVKYPPGVSMSMGEYVFDCVCEYSADAWTSRSPWLMTGVRRPQ